MPVEVPGLTQPTYVILFPAIVDDGCCEDGEEVVGLPVEGCWPAGGCAEGCCVAGGLPAGLSPAGACAVTIAAAKQSVAGIAYNERVI